MRGFEAFAIFALFYPIAGLDSISRLLGHRVDTKSANPTTKSSLSDEPGFSFDSRMAKRASRFCCSILSNGIFDGKTTLD
jgi:hypothetical protein